MSRVGKQIYPEVDDDSVLHTTYYHLLKYGTDIASSHIDNDPAGVVHSVTSDHVVAPGSNLFDFDFSAIVGEFADMNYGVLAMVHVINPGPGNVVGILQVSKTSTTVVRALLSASIVGGATVTATFIFIGKLSVIPV